MKTSLSRLLTAPGPALRLAGGLGLLSMAAYATPTLSAAPIVADISLNVNIDAGPPAPRHEVIIESGRPGPDYVWAGGYWDGSPGHYVWVTGHWDRPPHPHSEWMAPHWEKDHDGHFHQVKGEWRDGR
jgi:hypothetical protein